MQSRCQIPARLLRLPRHPLTFLLGLMLLALAPFAMAQASVPVAAPILTEPTGKAITSASDFWNLPEAEKTKTHRLSMELLVYYYDPAWKLLYGQTGDVSSYLPATTQPLPIRPGQKVRLEGTIIPAEGFDGTKLKVTLLSDGQLPKPQRTAGRMQDLTSLNGRWVQIEGYVLSQNEPDTTHVEARLWSEGRRVDVTVQINGTEPVPQFAGARVRIFGVYDVAVDSTGGIQAIKLWTHGTAQVELLGWLADDERFKLPATPIDQLAETTDRSWVRIVGRVQPQENGGLLTVRDETGQVEIRTAQPDSPPPGSTVEVIGHAASADTGWTLKESLFRRLDAVAALRKGPGGLTVRLRLAEQVVQLTPNEAEKRYPVTLRGVVSWYDEWTSEFYLQDVSGGVAVLRPPGVQLSFGASVVVMGVTARGRLRPVVEATMVGPSGSATLPPPRRISLDQALDGAEEGRWVEMRGLVRQVAPSEGWTRLDLTATTGEFSAYLPRDDSLANLRGAMVRVQGVCVAQPGANREAGDVRVWLRSRDGVLVDVPASADPFATNLETIANLRQLPAAQAPNARVKVAGVVTLHRPGRYLYLQDGDAGLFVLTRETKPLQAGQAIELVGLPGQAGSRVALREGIWRETAARPAVVPRAIESVAMVDPTLDMRVVRLAATVRQVSGEDARWRLSLEADGRIFESSVPDGFNWRPPAAGSRLSLTGVYITEFDEYRQPRNFRLELRGPDDVMVVAAAPLWTGRRIGYVVGGLAFIILLTAAWVVALRRRVRAQTEQIRLQLEKEAQMQTEIERTSRLESLGVLAGGIAHDFNNLLTAVLGNLGLASLDKRAMEAAGDCIVEAERGARRARDITQQLLTFAKGGDPVRKAVALPEIVKEAADFARHGSGVRFDFDLPVNLPPGDVDAGQISRVVHNLVINAVQAMPTGGVVGIALAAQELRAGEVESLPAGSYLRLTVVDSGEGIPADVLPRIFDPYFSTKSAAGNNGLGLATVHSIVKKHGGHVEVESKARQGTTFRVWLPAARTVPAPAPAVAAPATGRVPARILVMDDEDVIRRVAGRMLSLAGHEAVFAINGGEAVRAYVDARQSGRPFDLVIFDLTVPGAMGGKDALQELLQVDPGIRAMASSGYSSDPVMANPRTYGFRTSLPKPYDIPDLMRAVEETRGS